MNKTFILARSHFRKNKGTTIGLLCLMLIAVMLLSASLLLIFDAYPLATRESERLDSGSGRLRIYNNLTDIDEEFIDELLSEDCVRYDVQDCLCYNALPVPFGNGKTTVALVIDDDSAFEKEMGRTEVVTEDTSIADDYIYLPYQFYTSGGYDIGDTYTFDLLDRTYDLTVRGFTTTPYYGCNNVGGFEVIVDDDTYAELYEIDGEEYACLCAVYELKDGVKNSKFEISLNDKVIARNSRAIVSPMSIEFTNEQRTFMSKIIAVSFLVVTLVIFVVVFLMLTNCITNYIKENMKTLGALKAIGYTSSDIRASLLVLFGSCALIGALIGIILSYVIMPYIASFAIAQMGIPYTVSFNAITSVASLLAIVAFTCIVTAAAVIKVRKIEPIVALREGTESHNFRKNRFALNKTHAGLDFSLAMKTMCFNMKQNVITFFVIGIIMFLCTIALLMYYNFNKKPRLEILTFEITSGVVAVDPDTADELEAYLESRDDLYNVRQIIDVWFTYNGEDSLKVYICDDTRKLKNQDVCYSGRLPEYDNEIAVSGRFAKDYGFEIGDEIPMTYGDDTYTYLITGLIQTTNEAGRQGVLNFAGAEHLIDFEYIPGYYWFDCDDTETTAAIIDDCSEEFGDHIVATMNFNEILEGSMTTFKGLAAMMLVFICIISAALILLVLYLLIKAFIFSKRKDYGIYKAIGYTSNSLILQTALSFMPSIIVSAVVFSVVSYYVANPYMNLIMTFFGIVKSNFVIPVPGLAAIALGVIVISFLFAMFEARKIKNIEAYNMLLAE